jgi:hypothetical protein
MTVEEPHLGRHSLSNLPDLSCRVSATSTIIGTPSYLQGATNLFYYLSAGMFRLGAHNRIRTRHQCVSIYGGLPIV